MEPEREKGEARLRPLPFRQLVRRMGEEYRNAGSIFGIPQTLFFRKSGGRRAELAGEGCDLPLGPAAGPHTQLAQNIVAAWLAGARFFELKTVQKLDALRIAKPCIDASDGAFNTEWSTELSLEQALGEYVKAWAALHLLEEALGLGRAGGERSFLFDLSVGYDLEGIRSPAMDRLIDGLADASRLPVFRSCLEELAGLPADGGGFPRPVDPRALLPRVSPRICRSVSLSTMHGCPPGEIEAICLHLLETKNLATLLKLNPTLVGLERAEELLRAGGWGDLELDGESFRRDLGEADALRLLERLLARARAGGRRFGVKLTNTLEVVNTRGVLPGERMYLSGRALHPLSLEVAARLAEAFDGGLPISFSGGASAESVAGLLAAGIRPVTVVSELLAPDGYLRLGPLARAAEAAPGWERPTVDAAAVRRLAEAAAAAAPTRRPRRRAPGDLRAPLFDCAGCRNCVDVCPNRANLALASPDEAGWTRPFQIVHLAGWCNECGACAAPCPYPGARPWRDKLTLFPDGPAFEAAEAYGFLLRELPAGGRELDLWVGGAVRRLPVAEDGPAALPEEAAGEEGGFAAERALRLFALLWRDHRTLLEPEGGP